MILGGFDRSTFLRSYWQQQPLLIRHRGAPFEDPLDADELAGLACEPDMESRLISRSADHGWQPANGPFEPERFAQLGDQNWTLLVQAVDQVDPRVNQLKAYFDFLPAWRIDDVMVSYACDGGGVGPHFDHYDVFLIQGRGSRTWQTGQRCDSHTPLRTDTELSILQDFSPRHEYLLETGDMLYLPPGVAHHGVSLGESLCYSVGFRAPSVAELLQEYTDRLVETVTEDQRFQDPPEPLADAASPGNQMPATQISQASVAMADRLVTDLTAQRELLRDVLGAYATRPRYPERIQPPACQVTLRQLEAYFKNSSQGAVFSKNPASRFFFLQNRELITLYVDESPLPCPAAQLPLVRKLCQTPWHEQLTVSRAECGLQRDSVALLLTLLNQGSLLFDPSGEHPAQND